MLRTRTHTHTRNSIPILANLCAQIRCYRKKLVAVADVIRHADKHHTFSEEKEPETHCETIRNV